MEPEPFEFQSNGDTLVGYVMKRWATSPGKKYPGVLWVHGGPKTTLGRLLFHEMQYLCGLGYFVFYTNPHGSGGHGVKFSDIRGHYGDIDFDDLMTFTDQVLERYPDVDPGRLAEMGGSYGGFMTNWVIGHTDRFPLHQLAALHLQLGEYVRRGGHRLYFAVTRPTHGPGARRTARRTSRRCGTSRRSSMPTR